MWEKWKEGRVLEVVDSSLNFSSESEVLRCIQVGFLCLQEKEKDRPNMLSIVFMLGNETPMLTPIACILFWEMKLFWSSAHIYQLDSLLVNKWGHNDRYGSLIINICMRNIKPFDQVLQPFVTIIWLSKFYEFEVKHFQMSLNGQ